jgi:hypothetical protein
MNRTIVGVAVAAALAFAIPDAHAQGSAEIDTLRSQLQEMQAKLEKLEQQQKAQQDSQDKATDAVAQVKSGVGDWVTRFQWKGDLRYRNETIDQEFAADERNRDRIRARAGFVARVNDTLKAEVQAATTEGGDARSSNQTLTNPNSRKALDLDMAYAEWQPNAHWRATFGKMRYPWARSGSNFFDNDINPEGVGIAWQQGANGLFGSVFYADLMERSVQADSKMAGAQIGWRGDIASGTRLTLAAGYFGHSAVEGYNAVQDGNVAANAFGNSTTNSTAICRPNILTTSNTVCIANDYDIMNLFGELSTSLAGRPLSVFADVARNDKADFSNASVNPAQNIPAGLDTAWGAGFQYGRVSGARTWELGYSYHVIEKDALYGQWIDSDFAGGVTDGEGSMIRLGYGFARNFRLNGTYFLTKTNVDVAASVTPPGATAPVFVNERDYKRLQVDVNMSF